MLSVGGGNQNKEDGVKGASNLPNKGVVAAGAGGWGGGVTRSWGTTVSGGQSISNSNGSGGSPPSSRSEPPVVAVPSTDKSNNNTFSRLHHLDINNNGGEDAGSPDTTVVKKKKRGQRAAGGDKNGRGLRQFSMKVCEKVESKGRTTYNEVADELVAEFSDPTNSLGSPDQQQYDEKNIRRRVYDALNVLMAMDIISKDKKEIQWKGLPRTTVHDVEELKAERAGLRSRIEKKAAYLQELEEQFVGLQNLIQRNEQLCASGNGITGGVSLPFILVQTRPHATVEVEISEDMQLVHFDFNSTPFELHDDNYVLKAMNLCGRPESDDANCDVVETGGGESCMMVDVDQPATPHILIPNAVGTSSSTRGPTSPPLPGILKARVKHEH